MPLLIGQKAVHNKKRQTLANTGECVKKLGLHCWWGWNMVQLLWKTVWQFLTNLNIDLPYDLTIQLLGIYPREVNTRRLVHESSEQHYL